MDNQFLLMNQMYSGMFRFFQWKRGLGVSASRKEEMLKELSRRELIIGGLSLATPDWGLAFTEPMRSSLSVLQPPDYPGDWIRTARILVAEAYNPPFYPKLEYDPEKAIHLAEALHANAFRYPALSY
jgi:hypothetical protein